MSNTKKNLGHVTAYAYYKAGGGTMTEEEFTEYMADFGDAAERAVDAASEAAQSKADAQTAATTATNKADEAAASASSASGSAASAAEDASTASTAANTATGAATTATSAKNDAVSAKNAAQTAQTTASTAASTATTKAGEAATSATNAAASAQSVASSAAQITQNAEDIDTLKEELSSNNAVDYINANGTFTDDTMNGITFDWTKNKCHVSGTSTSTAFSNIFVSYDSLPNGMSVGDTVRFKIDGNPTGVVYHIFLYPNTLPNRDIIKSSDFDLVIPSGCVGIAIRLEVQGGVSVPGGTYVTLRALNTLTNVELTEQVNNISPLVDSSYNNNQHYLFKDYLAYLSVASKTASGISFAQNTDGSFALSGTADAAAYTYFNIYRNKTAFPDGMVAGGTYTLYAKSELFDIRVITYVSADDGGTELFVSDANDYIKKVFTIPSNATGIDIRLQRTTVSGRAYNESNIRVVVSDIKQLERDVVGDFVVSNKTTNIWCLGNSFMTGAVWANNAFNHFVGYDDSIYGQVATALHIPKENVKHDLYSSTGLISADSGTQGSKSFLEIIKESSLANYDYLMTQINGTDISENDLGSVSATADDGTIAGAVVSLVNYIRSNNGLCKLILFSVPPYSADIYGNNVFVGNWPQGYSIDDLDDVMYALAKKYHFIYISWQDLEISYHYMDYADSPEQGGTRHAKDDSVYRAFGEYVALQIKAVNSPIALSKLI